MTIFRPADILIPKGTDFSKWSVVACDQYTSQPEYWEKAARIAAGSPSALNIIFPEVYLDKGDNAERIASINKTMAEYLSNGIFEELKDSFILAERVQSNGKTRKGIIGCIDLEEYDFSKGSQSRIRATEGTIISRIPPRREIRKNAPLELPHILMLIDDPERSVIEPVSGMKDKLKKLYDFELMLGGGHIEGYLIDGEAKEQLSLAVAAFETDEKRNGLVYAVGDGNHSLATAKTCWEEIKQTLADDEKKTHPARYALVELNNIHDTALEFEPIQRVVFGVEPEALLNGLIGYYKASRTDNGGQEIRYTYHGNEGSIYVQDAPSNLPVGTLQKYIDKYLEENGGEVDYIHGDSVVRELAAKPDTIGFMVDRMEKDDLFPTVIKDGALPRKTFSMGEAQDKRYYIEFKRITL